MKRFILIFSVILLVAGAAWAIPPGGGSYQPLDADVSSIASGLVGIIKGAGDGAGYIAADAQDVAGLFEGSGDYLKADGSTGTPSGLGDVTGPASSTDNALPRFNGSGGKTLQISGVTVDDSDNVTIPGTLTVQGSGGITVSKQSGVAGTGLLYEANSTDTNGTGWKGPASRASDLYLQFPDADPTTGQFLLFPAPTTGTAAAAWQTYGTFTAPITLYSAADPDVDAEGEFAWDSNGDYARAYDGTRQVAVARVQEEIHVTVVKPQDMADAVRDAFLVWSNESGMSFIITGWKAWAGTDDTTLNIEETDADGQNNATVDAVEIATNGTGLYYASDTTITGATIETGHLLWLDFDDTDDPSYVKLTIYGYYSADVN